MNNEYKAEASQHSFLLLDICCKKVAEKISKKPIAEWVNSDYIKLSVALARQTKITLSENTLKRIFGKLKTTTRYFPQKATRNALAQFIGYRDWHEFELATLVTTPAEQTVNCRQDFKSKNYKKLIGLIFLVALLASGTVVLFLMWKPSHKNTKLVVLNTVGKTPHSALFTLKPKSKSADDNFTINFKDHRVATAKFNRSVLTHYYELPGVYYPTLNLKEKPIDTGLVILNTNGWTATISTPADTSRVYPVELKDNSPMALTMADIYRAGIDTSNTFYTHYANIKPTTINGDNFSFSGDLQTSPNRAGIRCSQVTLQFFGQTDYHALRIIKPECVSWTYYKFGEKSEQGEKSDLRALGYDLTTGKNIKISVSQKQVKVYINHNLIFKTSYTQRIGNLSGLSIAFAGLGKINNIKVNDKQTKEAF